MHIYIIDESTNNADVAKKADMCKSLSQAVPKVNWTVSVFIKYFLYKVSLLNSLVSQ